MKNHLEYRPVCPAPRGPIKGLPGLLVAVGVALACGGALAVAVAGPGGTAEQGRRVVRAAPVIGGEAPVLALVSARLDAVDVAHMTVSTRGQTVALHPTALQVMGLGGGPAMGAGALRPGMRVRFALEPETGAVAASTRPGAASGSGPVVPPAPRRIVLVYIDAAS